MATCEACSVVVECNDGCGVVCVNDCGSCTFWCESTTLPPITVSDLTAGTLVQISKSPSGQISARMHEAGKASDLYDDDQQFKLCFKDLPLASLARLLGSMSKRTLRVPSNRASERMSGSGTGTVVEFAAKYSLLVD